MSEGAAAAREASYRLVSRHRRGPWRLLVATSLVAALAAGALHLHRLASVDAALENERTAVFPARVNGKWQR